MNFTRLILLIVFSWLSGSLRAQVYLKDRSQHRFAQTYVGLNLFTAPSQGALIWNGKKQAFPSTAIPRFTIGGLHFWGKVDFNINIALGFLGNRELDANTKLKFSPGGDLSARYYPWRVEYGKLRPYFGVSFNQMVFGIETTNSGERKDVFITGSSVTGISYAFNGNQVNLEMLWVPFNKRNFYSTRLDQYKLSLPTTYFSIGFTRFFDVTLKNEQDKRNGREALIEKSLSKNGGLNSLSLGIAPSWTYFIESPSYASAIRQSVPRHDANFVWEFGLGYLLHNQGIHFGLSYRDNTSSRESYGLDHLIRRRTVAIEGFKFFWNYNGFVPFIGPSISFEKWAVGEFEGSELIGEVNRTKIISPGVIFGWDILATSLETWVLRTNLRYYPFQKIKNLEGRKSRVDQFEFNFIQLVVYPGRMVRIKKAKSII